MILCFVLLSAMAGLLFVSAWMQLPDTYQSAGWKMPFLKSAYFMLRSENNEERIRQLADALLVLFFGLGMTLLAENVMGDTNHVPTVSDVTRPQNGAGSQTQKLQAQVEGMTEAAQMDVTISERQYTEAEKTAFLEQALQELDSMILGENKSADEVRERIVLPTELLDGKVTIQWRKEVKEEQSDALWPADTLWSSDTLQSADELISADGVISEELPPEGVLLHLQGTLVCQDQEAVFQRVLRLFPPIRSEEEALLYELGKQIKKADQDTLEEETLALPTQVQGRKVSWKKGKTSVVEIGILLTLAVTAGIYFGKEQERKKREQLRRQQLLMDFPSMLFQLAMLLEAGLTMQNAFFCIAWNYRERQERECRFVYEEMLISCYEMQSGVAERKAYEDFGRRCGENCYMRFGTMLAASLQKGAQGLTTMMLEEAESAMEVRRQLAKKLGEEAGTKLLLPMILMLLVVLVILMVPAMMSF